MPPNLSDFVQDSKLRTEFLVGRVRHTRYIQGNSFQKRQIQVKEVWDTEKELARGTYGVVTLEKRRPTSIPELESQHNIRAVKKIRKTVIGGNKWDYKKELETMTKFSHPRYAPYFVRTYGWFENTQSVFITMEYFPLGDLHNFMRRLPPFSEGDSKQIVRQLLEGVEFMHESGFAHRDIKPGNILVESNSPEWLIKIADFGISKRAQEGETDFRTHVGTSGYIAPEVIGFFSENGSAVPYSVAVDIWAIGIITVELLLKRLPFINIYDLTRYLDGKNELQITVDSALNLSDTCRDLFVEDNLQEDPLGLNFAATPASVPSLPWSNLHLTDSTTMIEPPSRLLTTYHGSQFVGSLLSPAFRDLSLEALDVETSAAHRIWTSSKRVNTILDKGYKKTDGRVILFFSVVKSRKFCGVARMTSSVDWVNTDEHWQEDSWKG
ncbi:calcium/calmodulin-dependent protein kinase [Halenospora varia]|nr:calcium/calmodulin-dependent protein kinase [Halenospora varia]